MKQLRPVVKKAFESLLNKYECIVAEGAGSPVELNLMDKDLSNIYIAKEFKNKIVLVADIERGGVFASIYGVYNLLPKRVRKNIIGVIINKFQGDMRLFDSGIEIIQKRFKIPVLGVVPFKPFNLGFEDSASLMGYTQDIKRAIIKVGVIKLPYISNFTDFEPLVVDEEIELCFISSASEVDAYDLLVIPGSKRVVDDLEWLKKRGFGDKLNDKERRVIAICGGYEMLFERILDPHAVESKIKSLKGFGVFRGDVIFKRKKIVQKGCYNLFGTMVDGYEIHNGITKKRAKRRGNIYGTFVHGLFESDDLRFKILSEIDDRYRGYNFQNFKSEAIALFANHIETHIDMDRISRALNE